MLKKIMEFFEMPIGQFGKEWKQLSEDARRQIRDGIENGSLTY